jgi:hypothetical protein
MTADNHVMVTVSYIADRDGVSKQAVSKTVRKMLAARPGTPVDLGPQGQVLRVSLAHYDEFRHRHVNPAKASAPLRPGGLDQMEPPLSASADRESDSFEEARRQAEWLKVGRERIRQQEDCGQLIRKDKTEEAVATIASALQQIIRQLPNRADEVAIAVSKEGVHGVRTILRRVAFEIGNKMADRLQEIAAAMPEHDPLIEDVEE